jgi:3-dehydroquinate synthase
VPQPTTVTLNLANHRYDIVVGRGVLDQVGERLAPLVRAKQAAIVFDANVVTHYRGALLASLCDTFDRVIENTVPASEDHKTVETVHLLYDQILQHRIDRHTPVIALGGGVVGDTAGFVAATILRGVPFVQIPTTLLSMVDASVGGKTGVNHAVGKNLIGAFHQPIAVFIDPEVLRTLPPRELRSGLAECIKHDIIRDADGFARLERDIGRALKLDFDYLSELVAHNVAIKARVVEADPFERGERAHLNFGHTFGHAIETVMEYRYAHGECVALGMAAATFAAVKLGMFPDDQRKRLLAVIEQAGLSTRAPELPVDRVIEGMSFDKKVSAGKVRFVLPDRIGHVVIRDDVPAGIVREAVESLRG